MRPVISVKRKPRVIAGWELHKGLEEDDEIVSNRLPQRPRLRIDGLGKDGTSVDLIPVLNQAGYVVPDFWVLPQTRDALGQWQTNYAHTDRVRQAAEAQGMRVRILT